MALEADPFNLIEYLRKTFGDKLADSVVAVNCYTIPNDLPVLELKVIVVEKKVEDSSEVDKS